MKLFCKDKDGGPESKVWAYWLIEWKRAFSIAFLHFKTGGRNAYHSHAFSAISWVIKGQLTEHVLNGETVVYKPSFKPIFTPRDRFHKVMSTGTLVFTLRGPWADTWDEHIPNTNTRKTLTHGRREINAAH